MNHPPIITKINCTTCSKTNKKNTHRLNPLLFPIIYGSSDIITTLQLPRKYTSIHNDNTGEIFLSIDHTYNSKMLQSDEATKVQSQVVGKWVKKNNKYEIHLRVIVSSQQNPQAFIRNKIFCEELGTVLEGIALAESSLLKSHPKLDRTKIFVHFKSIDSTYQRVEYWNRLGYWKAL